MNEKMNQIYENLIQILTCIYEIEKEYIENFNEEDFEIFFKKHFDEGKKGIIGFLVKFIYCEEKNKRKEIKELASQLRTYFENFFEKLLEIGNEYEKTNT